ncbi:hypothetical protein D3C85_1703890 [compost metagenome]
MPDFAEPAGAVDFCRLIQLLINAGYSGQIEDCAPAKRLPPVPGNHGHPDMRAGSEKIEALVHYTELHQNVVHDSVIHREQ